MLPDENASILAVDDDKNTLDMYYELLTEEGYINIALAYHGIEALNILKQRPFDLMITGNNMPCMGGLELILEMNKIGLKMPIVMITGWGTAETFMNALNIGVYDIFTKPFNLETFRAVVANALRFGRDCKHEKPDRPQPRIKKWFALDSYYKKIGFTGMIPRYYDTGELLAEIRYKNGRREMSPNIYYRDGRKYDYLKRMHAS